MSLLNLQKLFYYQSMEFTVATSIAMYEDMQVPKLPSINLNDLEEISFEIAVTNEEMCLVIAPPTKKNFGKILQK